MTSGYPASDMVLCWKVKGQRYSCLLVYPPIPFQPVKLHVLSPSARCDKTVERHVITIFMQISIHETLNLNLENRRHPWISNPRRIAVVIIITGIIIIIIIIIIYLPGSYHLFCKSKRSRHAIPSPVIPRYRFFGIRRSSMLTGFMEVTWCYPWSYGKGFWLCCCVSRQGNGSTLFASRRHVDKHNWSCYWQHCVLLL